LDNSKSPVGKENISLVTEKKQDISNLEKNVPNG